MSLFVWACEFLVQFGVVFVFNGVRGEMRGEFQVILTRTMTPRQFLKIGMGKPHGVAPFFRKVQRISQSAPAHLQIPDSKATRPGRAGSWVIWPNAPLSYSTTLGTITRKIASGPFTDVFPTTVFWPSLMSRSVSTTAIGSAVVLNPR